MLYSLGRRRALWTRLVIVGVAASLMLLGPAAGAVIETDTACPNPPSAGFVDIGGYPRAIEDAIDCLADYDITTGTTSTTYSPEGDVARWQMALFLTRLAEVLDIDLPSGADQGFTDIGDLPLTTRRAINQLVQLGIATGTTSTTYAPNDVVTRSQMALFVTRLLDAAGESLPSGSDQGFTDVGVLPAATERAVNQLAQLDIVEGIGGSLYAPFGFVNRWQMALFLTRSLEARGVTPPTTTVGGTSPSPKVGAPDLERVTFDRDDDDETRLRFEFDEPVSVNIDENEFWLVGWNGDLINPNDAGRSSSSSDVVLADFDNEDYDNAVAAVVTIGAVIDIDNLENTIGSYPLNDVTVDSVDWPDDYPELIDVDEFDSTADTVEFEFDQDVDFIGSAADFYLVEEDGTRHQGDAIDDVRDEVVTVEFTDLSQNEWNDVVRGFAAEGAVEEDGGGLDNLPVAVDVSGAGNSDSPYIEDIDLTDVDDGVVVFEFSEDLIAFDGTSGNFQIVLHDGTVLTSTDEERDDADQEEVIVEFNGGAALPSDIVVYATVLDEAVEAFNGVGTEIDNGPDTHTESYRFNEGDTAGPDLESSKGSKSGLDDDTYTIVLTFDEDVDTAFDPSTELFGWDEEGELVDIDGGTLTIDDEVVEIEFTGTDDGLEELVDGDVVRFGILADQVTDEWGFSSYPDGVGVNQTK